MTTLPSTPRNYQVAALQMVSGKNLAANLESAAKLIAQASQNGAQLVLLPEYFCLMGQHDSDKVALRELDGDGPIQTFLATQARQQQIWLVGGTLPLATDRADTVWNSVLVFNPAGERVTRYDKIHLFSFHNGSESYDEARTIAAGQQPVAFPAPIGRVGLSVCYDLRFPELYRQLSMPDPLNLLLVPAAFTYTTGQAHWEILLRARAIENQCYVLAAAQGGLHENGRRTWGHSMLIDPWGEVIAVLPTGEGIVSGLLDLEKLATIRRNLPALQHRKLCLDKQTR